MQKYIGLIVVFIIMVACSNSKNKSGDLSGGIDGAKIFKTNCALCHGNDGKLGANGSKDLTASALTLDDRINIITNGKGTMAAYGAILSKEDIKAVAAYTLTLK